MLLSHYTDCRGNVNNCFQLENIVIRSCTAFRPWPAHRLFLKKRGRLKACPFFSQYSRAIWEATGDKTYLDYVLARHLLACRRPRDNRRGALAVLSVHEELQARRRKRHPGACCGGTGSGAG